MTVKKSLGTQLRDARKTAGLKQGDVADRLNIRQATLSAWENDRWRPRSAQMLSKLAEMYGADKTSYLKSWKTKAPVVVVGETFKDARAALSKWVGKGDAVSAYVMHPKALLSQKECRRFA